MFRTLFLKTILLIAVVCCSRSVTAQIVNFETNLGDITISLFPTEAPISVDNFLGYVNRGDYDGTIFHRSVDDFVVQGGGFESDFSPITVQSPIQNEFGRSNLRGTVAFARVGGSVDSATSQFFFNVTDNIFLDTVDEGFTVFGEVTAGLDVIDAINDLQIINIGGAFNELPVLDSFVAGAGTEADLVIVNSATVTSVPEPSSMIVISGLSMILLQRRRRTQKPKSISSN